MRPHVFEPTATPIVERVGAVFARDLQMSPAPDTDLFETSALDSLSFVTLLVGLEAEFGLSIPTDTLDLRHFTSIDAIAQFIVSCQSS